MKPNTATIYVALIGEGTNVWRPVEAELLGENRYRIISKNNSPEDEQWEFQTNDIVHCEQRVLSASASVHRVAVRRVTTDL